MCKNGMFVLLLEGSWLLSLVGGVPWEGWERAAAYTNACVGFEMLTVFIFGWRLARAREGVCSRFHAHAFADLVWLSTPLAQFCVCVCKCVFFFFRLRDGECLTHYRGV